MRNEYLIKRLLDKDYATLKDDIDSVVAAKIVDKVVEKKKEVIDRLNKAKIFGDDQEPEKENETDTEE